MAAIDQEQWTRVGEREGSVFSSLKRYEDAANLIANSFFAFVHRDEFNFFPDAGAQLEELTNLLRGVGYSSDTGLLLLDITPVSPGISYTLNIINDDADILATATGDFGVKVPVVPTVGSAFSPAGKIRLQNPLAGFGTPQRVEIRIVPSAVRLATDVLGETEGEQVLEAESTLTHKVTAGNLRKSLLDFARNRIVVTRALQQFVGEEFLGSTTKVIFNDNLVRLSDGSVISSPSGILPEMDLAMQINTPEQTVQQITPVVGSSGFDLPLGGTAGTAVVVLSNPTAGTFRAKFNRGFDRDVDDPEEATLEFNSTTLNRKIITNLTLRPFRQFDFIKAGYLITIKRASTSDDTFNRVTSPEITNARPGNIPLQRLTVETFIDPAGVPAINTTFKIIEPSTGQTLISRTGAPGADPLANGLFEEIVFNGLSISFTWVNNGAATGLQTFNLEIHPFKPGDVYYHEIESISGGRLNVETRKHFDFAYRQSTAGTPTIPDSVVSPDLPFVIPLLGA